MIDIIKVRRDLHQIPELGLKEYKTQQYILKILEKYRCYIYTIKTGIIAFFDNNKDHSIAYRCDMDGLPIKEENIVDYKSHFNMHACGHDGHMAIAIGLCDYLNKHYQEYSHNFVIIFQPSEEIFGGSKLILDSKILERLNVKKIIGIHLFPKLEKNTFLTSKHIFSSAREINFSFKSKSVHVANRNDATDCMKVGVKLINKITSLSNKSNLVHIGIFNSGSARNCVSDFCEIKGTIRSKKSDTKIIKKIAKITRLIEKKYHLKIDDTSLFLPSINNNNSMMKKASKLINLKITHKTYFQGEDFSLYTYKFPCLFLLYGIGEENYLHSPNFNFDDSLLINCLDQVIELMKMN